MTKRVPKIGNNTNTAGIRTRVVELESVLGGIVDRNTDY